MTNIEELDRNMRYNAVLMERLQDHMLQILEAQELMNNRIDDIEKT